MKQTFRLVLLLVVLCPLPVLAQSTSYQAKQVFHPTVDLDKHWFAAFWLINNAKADAPDNFNVFAGMGYRGKDWALEALYQRQFSKKGQSSALSFRFTKSLTKKTSLYAEIAPALGKRSVYNFAFVEHKVSKKLSLGGETENTNRQGKDSFGAGPSASWVVGDFGDTKVVTRVSYQFRPNEPNVLRWYLIVHTRFRKHKR